MKGWKRYCTGMVLTLGLTPVAWGQVPAGLPGGLATSPDVTGAAAGLAGGVPGSGRNLFSFFCPTAEQKAALKAKFCNSPFGQLFNGFLQPVSALSGGFIQPICTPFNAADLAKPADSPQGAAARIQQEEAEAKARRAAVRYLATVDCHYFPEANDALINALRADRNECVRYEAAMAFASGCCCTKKTIQALTITVIGSEEDGNPCEKSDRVRSAALLALNHCLACACGSVSMGEPVPVIEQVPPPKQKEEQPVPPKPDPEKLKDDTNATGKLTPVAYYRKVDKMPLKSIVERARQVTAQYHSTVPPSTFTEGGPGVLNILAQAITTQRMQPQAMQGMSIEPPVADAVTMLRPAMAPQQSVSRYAPVNAMTPAAAATMVPAQVPMTATPVLPNGAVIATEQPRPTVFKALRSAWGQPLPTGQVETQPVVKQEVVKRESATPASLTEDQVMSILRDSAYPDQREWAATQLCAMNWRGNPRVVQELVTSASRDPAATVRVESVRALAKMGVNTQAVVVTLQALTADQDPRVQTEAKSALSRLRSNRATPASYTPQTGTGMSGGYR